MINCKFLLSVVFLLSLVLPVFCFEPLGGVLMLDGEDDYAILPLAEHGYIFPRNTDEFTVEVWFYPKSRPEPIEKNILLSQQVAIGLKLQGNGQCRATLKKDQVCAYGSAYLEGVARGVRNLHVVIKKDQWNYLAILFKDSTIYLAYNDQIVRGQKRDIMNVVAAELRVREEFRSFFVGGYAEDGLIIKDGQVLARETYFHGEIDAIRFSNIARYDLPAELGGSPFNPPHRFSNDKHTLAFWDFNDKVGADRFEDESGNGYTLIGMNGVTTRGPLVVNPRTTSITTTWGQVKLDR